MTLSLVFLCKYNVTVMESEIVKYLIEALQQSGMDSVLGEFSQFWVSHKICNCVYTSDNLMICYTFLSYLVDCRCILIRLEYPLL